jgi:hypothetical protein
MNSYHYRRVSCLIEGVGKEFGFLDFSNLLATIVLLTVLLYSYDDALAVGGISNTKVIVPSAESVPKKHLEIEPFFGLVFADDDDNSVGLDAGSRLTFGLLDNLEAGANIGYLSIADSDVIDTEADFGNIEAGMKFRFIDEGANFPFSLAYQGGITFPTGGSNDLWVFEPFGFILTKNFSDSFSMDADFVLALVEDKSVGFVAEIGFGYFVKPWFQPVIEAGYSLEGAGGEEAISVFDVTAGFTAPVSEMLAIIFGVTPDLHTRNVDKEILITAAFTFLF